MLTEQQIERYSRQIILPEVGGRGQQLLLASSVALVGAGGVGSTAAIYLAAAGIGTMTIIDDHPVQPTDLSDTAAYTPSELGQNRAVALTTTLAALNPDCRAAGVTTALTTAAATSLARDHDVLIDTTAEWDTGARLNAAAVQLGKSLVWGTVAGFEGEATTFAGHLPAAPCYRCLHPQPPPAPQTAGVFNVAAGFIGTLVATETIRIVLGLEVPLRGRVAVYDALAGTVQDLRVARRPHCMGCNPAPAEEQTNR